MYYIYFLKSLKNNKIYTGSTSKNPIIRLKEHNQNSTTWTKENGPFILLYFESYCCEKDARQREQFYKSGFGRKIRNLIFCSVSARGGSACG